jgi:hypothetical protein
MSRVANRIMTNLCVLTILHRQNLSSYDSANAKMVGAPGNKKIIHGHVRNLFLLLIKQLLIYGLEIL